MQQVHHPPWGEMAPVPSPTRDRHGRCSQITPRQVRSTHLPTRHMQVINLTNPFEASLPGTSALLNYLVPPGYPAPALPPHQNLSSTKSRYENSTSSTTTA